MVSRSISRTILERYYTKRILISMEQVASSSISSVILIKHFLNTSMITMIMKSSKFTLCQKINFIMNICKWNVMNVFFTFIDLFKNFYSCNEEAVKDERSIWIYKKLIQICCCPMKTKWKCADWFCFFLRSLNEALVFYHLLNNSKKKEYWRNSRLSEHMTVINSSIIINSWIWKFFDRSR